MIKKKKLKELRRISFFDLKGKYNTTYEDSNDDEEEFNDNEIVNINEILELYGNIFLLLIFFKI